MPLKTQNMTAVYYIKLLNGTARMETDPFRDDVDGNCCIDLESLT